MDVDGHVLLVVAGFRLGRSAGTAQVRNNDRVTCGEGRHDRMPHMAGFGITVQQDHRAILAADEITQSNSVDLGEALGKAGRDCAIRGQERRRCRRQRGDQFFGGQDRVSEGRTIQLMRGAHHLALERGRCILHQGDVVAELHREAACRLDTSVCQQTDNNDFLDAVLFELLVEIRVGKATLRPMLLDNDIALPGNKIRVPLTAPCPFGEGLPFARGHLAGVRVFPLRVVTRFRAMVRHDEQLNFRSACCRDDLPQMVKKIFLHGDRLDHRPELTALGQEIIIGVDEKQAGIVGGIAGRSHVIFLRLK